MPFSISVVAPAAYTDPKIIDDAVAALGALGIQTHVPATLQAPCRYLAGSVAHRLDRLYAAYEDPRTEAVWAVRGGYGCAQLIPHLDWSRLTSKPLIGYSDITVLLDQCYRHGLPAIHGPVVKEAVRLRHASPEQRSIAQRQIEEVMSLLKGNAQGYFPLVRYDETSNSTSPLEGPLVGGNLMTLASIAGTSMEFVAPPGALVILEDVGEPYYRLERALWQLVHAGALNRASAVCLGTFEGCSPYNDIALEVIFNDILSPLGLALFTGLPVGHGEHNRPWRYGTQGRIENDVLQWQ